MLIFVMLAASCGSGAHDGSAQGQGTAQGQGAAQGQDAQEISVSGDGIDGELTFTLPELKAMQDAVFEHVYSTINNWPAAKFYAARGIRVATVLKAAGVLETAKLITFRSNDSYEVTLTRRQLLEDEQFYFPSVESGSGEGAEKVEPILAYEFKEGSSDMAKTMPEEFCLIIGQRNYAEHTNPALVENIKEIVVSAAPPEKWQQAGIFPVSGRVSAGDSIKLQHPEFGLVKLFYTVDGSDPTEMSAMYNPSTYQPELNKPIVFNESAVLKVLVTGYGREDSDIAVFNIEVL